jgi:hypothetical protein
MAAWLLVPLSPAMMDALAAFEADQADLEDDDPAEDNGDAEPSLGATDDKNQEKAWRDPEIGEIDLEYEGDGVPDADAETMLGAPEHHPMPYGYGRDRSGDQTWWARGSGTMEEEAVNEDGGNIEDEGQADTFEHNGAVAAGNCDDEPSLGATTAIDQRQAWAAPDTWTFCEDGEATGTEDDAAVAGQTVEQREATQAAARDMADKALTVMMRTRRTLKGPVRLGDNLTLVASDGSVFSGLPLR